MLLAAGRGVRFRPVTESVPKPLFPYLNVPLVRAHLSRLAEAGVSGVGINLHHLGDAIEKYLAEQPGPAPRRVAERARVVARPLGERVPG